MKRKEQTRLNFEKAEQARRVLETNPNFQEAVLIVQSKFRISADDPERGNFLSRLPEIKIFTLNGRKSLGSYRVVKRGDPLYKEVVKILKLFKLPGNYWYEGVSHYVLYNTFSPGHKGLSEAETEPDIVEGKESMTDLPTFSIKVGRNTTLEDIKFLWPAVEMVRSGEYDEIEIPKRRFGQRKNYDRDCYIYRLYSAAGRKLTTEVLGIIWNRIKTKYNQDLEYQTIKTVVTRMKKGLNKKPLGKVTP